MIHQIRSRLAGRRLSDLPLLIAKNLVAPLAGLSPAARAARDADLAFDRRWGTETSGLANLSALDVDRARAAHGVRYQPSRIDKLEWAVAATGTVPGDWRFVDYGSGKGRVVMAAAAMGFAKVIGVEFSQELCAVARDNVARFVAAGGAVPAPTIVAGDAGQYEPPAGDLIAYFYNPFGPPVIDEVIARLAAHRAGGARVRVVYVDPRHLDRFEAAGWHVRARGEDVMVLD